MRLFRRNRKIPVKSLQITRDIHTHLLPGVDDGKFTPGNAAGTLAGMYAHGIRQVCITPHIFSGLYDNTPESLKEALDGFVASMGDNGEIPALSLGAEYMVDDVLLSAVRERNNEMLTVFDNHLLIEMSYYGISPQIFEVVAGLVGMGYRPVLAHPERYLYLDGNMGVFDKLYDMGCTFQLNLPAVTGVYGDAATKIMKNLFERSYYQYVGSDIHSPQQFERLYGSFMSEKIALEGERAQLWNIL